MYEDHNPANFVQNWKTPELIIHGSKGLVVQFVPDYRLPTHRIRGIISIYGAAETGVHLVNLLIDDRIPSRLVIFRKENHFVLNPKNSLKWHEEVIGWITKWTSHPHVVEDEPTRLIIQS